MTPNLDLLKSSRMQLPSGSRLLNSRGLSAKPVSRPAALVPSRTPRSTTTRTGTTRHDDSYIIALIDNSVKDVGFCAYNLTSVDMQLRQFADSNTFSAAVTALCVFTPVEIILSVSSGGGLLDQAIQMCPHLTNVKRTYIGRSYFNETNGALAVEKLSNIRCSHLSDLGESTCYLALASCGALVKYVENVEGISFPPSSLRISFRPNDGVVFLDMATLEALEIVSNAQVNLNSNGTQSKACLLRVMDKTKTRAGKRFLRRSLLEPCATLNTVIMRQDAVEELSINEDLYYGVVNAISCFPDLERSLAALMVKENARLRLIGTNKQQKKRSSLDEEDDSDDEITSVRDRLESAPPSVALITNILNIKMALECVPKLLEAVEQAKAELLKAIAESMRNPALQSLEIKIKKVIEPEAIIAKDISRMRMQGAFAVKKGLNGRLDIIRDSLTDNIQEIQAHAEEIRNKYGLHKLQLYLYAKRGYYFALHRKLIDIRDLPDEFITVNTRRTMYHFSTERLRQLNCRYHDNLREIWKLTEFELGSLFNEIFKRDCLVALHRLCDSTALLDYLSSCVTYSSLSAVITERPKLTENGPIALRKAYHPTLLVINPQTAVPNDIFLDEASAVHIISGRNNSGKTTFIKMVAVICVMALTGCMIPAQFASIRILRKICARFGGEDDISQSQSHFSREMKGIASILDGIKPRIKSTDDKRSLRVGEGKDGNNGSTLILIDELGRSTSTMDGFAFAYAIIEYLASVPNVLTLFTTHFLGLGAIVKVNPTIKAFHMNTINRVSNHIEQQKDETNPNLSISFTYTIEKGILTDCIYGIETARLAGFDQDVIKDAMELRKNIPVRRISVANEFERVHFQLNEMERKKLKKLFTMVLIDQRISVILSSAGNEIQSHQLLKQLQQKIKTNPTSNKNMDNNNNDDDDMSMDIQSIKTTTQQADQSSTRPENND